MFLGSCTMSPERSLVTVEVERRGQVNTAAGVVLENGLVLVSGTIEDRAAPVDRVSVVTIDGSVHSANGVAAHSWVTSLLLLDVEWQGPAPPGLKILEVDQIDAGVVKIRRADMEPVQAIVPSSDAINSSVRVAIDESVLASRFGGSVVTDDRGHVLAIVNGFMIGVSLRSVGGLPIPQPNQELTCTPGAWITPLMKSVLDEPIPWSEWQSTVKQERAVIGERIKNCRELMFEDVNEALPQLIKLAADDPSHPEAWSLLAHSALNTGNPSTAGVAAQRALALDPGLHEAAVALAAAQIELNEIDAARTTIDRALRMKHDGLWDHYVDARLLHRSGLSERALVIVGNILKVDPTDERALDLRTSIEHELGTADPVGSS
jgi:hypothetical protein